MRGVQWRNMIGSLLCYVLYPLSRYLAASRRSEAVEKGLPSAAVHGPSLWDGGSVTTRILSQSRTALLDQCLSPSSATEGETEERMTEKSPGKEDNKDEEPECEEPHSEALNTVDEQRENMQVAIQVEVMPRKQNTEDATVAPAEAISPQQAQFEHLHRDDSTEETDCTVQEQKQVREEPAVSPTCSMKETNKEQMLIPSGAETVTSYAAADDIPECWDEYTFVQDGGSGLFSSLLSNSQSHLELNKPPDRQTGWHAAAGPGLAEDAQCPLWQFPVETYYPPTESAAPLEGIHPVMWRVWQDMDESAPAAQPGQKPFQLANANASMDFTIMTYNILAQDLLEANQELYIHCPLEVLDWSYRFNLILKEIMDWTPDILCLQEVQENHYYEQLHPALSRMGYTCVYKRRTGTKTDGCATCYRNSCFSEVSVTCLEFFRPDIELLNRHNVGIVLLLRPDVNQGVETKVTGPFLCVANTHLLFNPGRGDVKLAQLAMMLAEIDSVVRSCKDKGDHCNVILCGDFNSLPHVPLYQLITTARLCYQGLPAWMVSGQEDMSFKLYCHRLCAPLWPSSLGITDRCQYATIQDKFESHSQKSGKHQYSHKFMLQLRNCPAACVRPVDLVMIRGVTDNTPAASIESQFYDKSFRHAISHRLDLESVYEHILPGSGMPEVTTLHSEGGGTVDYIFYSPRRTVTPIREADGDFVSHGLKLMGRLSLPSEEVVWSQNGLPSHMAPSDHLSLVATFQMDLDAE